MIIKRKLIKLGKNSKVITLPQNIVKNLSTKKKYKFKIKFLGEIVTENMIREYKCLICNYIFCSDENYDYLYCPNCGEEVADNFIETYNN